MPPHFGPQTLLVVRMEHLRQIGVGEVALAQPPSKRASAVLTLHDSAFGGHEDHADGGVRECALEAVLALAKLGQMPGATPAAACSAAATRSACIVASTSA